MQTTEPASGEVKWLLHCKRNVNLTSHVHLLPCVPRSGQAGSRGNAFKGSLTGIWHLKCLSPGTF